SVGVAAICWPLGQPLDSQDPNCRRQRFAWTLDGTTPPTLQALDQPLGLGLQQTLWVDAQGRQTAAGCAGALPRQLIFWPAALEPWLPRRERRSARLPASDPACPPELPVASAPLSIVGVREGDQLRRPAASAEALRLKLSALGGSGRRWWFLDGVPLTDTAEGDFFHQSFQRLGRYQLSVLDEAGQTARLEFSLVQ
ncbi:MAG TPA: penicillin-binding protein 1C, partial [Pseudomonas sp.]|nr:penicillin-binding protein 1C [Pseudomonas sp.]